MLFTFNVTFFVLFRLNSQIFFFSLDHCALLHIETVWCDGQCQGPCRSVGSTLLSLHRRWFDWDSLQRRNKCEWNGGVIRRRRGGDCVADVWKRKWIVVIKLGWRKLKGDLKFGSSRRRKSSSSASPWTLFVIWFPDQVKHETKLRRQKQSKGEKGEKVEKKTTWWEWRFSACVTSSHPLNRIRCAGGCRTTRLEYFQWSSQVVAVSDF